MNNIKVKILLPIITLITLWSCSSENNEERLPLEDILRPEDCEVVFQSSVITQTVESSRVGIIVGSHFPENHRVGIYAQKTTWSLNDYGNKVFENVSWDEENIHEGLNNAEYKALGESCDDKLEPVNGINPKFYAGENSALRIYSYAPYTENIIQIPLQAPRVEIVINESMEKTEDYLYATPLAITTKGTTTNIELKYKHLLSKINFRIFTNDSKYSDGDCPKLTEIVIITRHHQGGYLNIQTGEIYKIENPEKENKRFVYSLAENPHKIVNGGSTDIDANFFFIPDENAISQILLKIINPGSTEETELEIFKYDIKQPEPKNLKQGNIYTINVEYSVRSSINAQIESWTETEDKSVTISGNNLIKEP